MITLKHSCLLLGGLFMALISSCNGRPDKHGNRDLTGRAHSVLDGADTVSAVADTISVIFQDSRNAYWFGSRGRGVFKFDGKSILQFTVKHGLVNNDIYGIQEDAVGNVYFDTPRGVSKYDGAQFVTLPMAVPQTGLWTKENTDMWFRGNWIGNGPLRYDGKQLHQLTFPTTTLGDSLIAAFPNMTWSPYGLYAVFEDSKGHVWFGTSNAGIYRFDGTSLRQMYEDHLTNTPEGGSFGIRSIFEDRRGDFWFCNTRYRFRMKPADPHHMDVIQYERLPGIVNTESRQEAIYFLAMTEDNQGDLWFLTYNDGVWRYNGKEMHHYDIKEGDRRITLATVFIDRNGQIWLGTNDAGVYRFNGDVFEKFKP